MAQKTKTTIDEIRVWKAENGYVVITDYIDDGRPPELHVSTNIDDVFATIEKKLGA